jgi:hypothetical protein
MIRTLKLTFCLIAVQNKEVDNRAGVDEMIASLVNEHNCIAKFSEEGNNFNIHLFVRYVFRDLGHQWVALNILL